LPDLSPRNLRSSDWRRLFVIACDLLDQAAVNSGGYPFDWSFGGGTAMMIQIGHRESHDIDIFLDDPQVLGFFDPAKAESRQRPAAIATQCLLGSGSSPDRLQTPCPGSTRLRRTMSTAPSASS
jgi:hypothetical protein